MKRMGLAFAMAALLEGTAAAKDLPSSGPPGLELPAQETNAYTRYELLTPGSGKFRIVYDVTAARPGAGAYFNPIRKGSIATDERVTDRATGAPLAFTIVSGDAAKRTGLSDADPSYDYIRVALARPVAMDGGEARIRIEKTYEDARSYRQDGQDIVFSRSLGVKRNAVVLPLGYRLLACSVPSQVEQEPDGRLKISFINTTPGEAPLTLRARRGLVVQGPSSMKDRFSERALQTRDIVYFLQQPETNAFDLYHDYTEERAGIGQYVNVVRTGSQASHPSGRNLDTGEVIPALILKGAAIAAAGVSDPDLTKVTADTEVVVFRFPPLKAGQSTRLRMSETYTDPGRYRLVGDELIFDRSFGRPANAVVLPAGWILSNSASPATITALPDGRTRLDFINPRQDDVDVLITARRAANTP